MLKQDSMVIDNLEFGRFLSKKLKEVQLKNPGFSLRRFADKIGVSASALSEMKRGKRKVSAAMVNRILDRLMVSPLERQRIMFVAPKSNEAASKTKKADTESIINNPEKILLLEADQFESISDSLHFSILSLMKIVDFKSDAKWISERLGVPRVQIEDALQRLERLNLIDRTTSDKWSRVKKSVHTTSDIPSVAIQASHIKDLDFIEEKIRKVPLALRDCSSITMAIDINNLPKAKKLIHDFREQMSTLLGKGEAKEVYKMSIYLVPVTVCNPETVEKNKNIKTNLEEK